MSKVSQFKTIIILLSVALLAQSNARASVEDESPLDSLIPKAIQNRIDQRKEFLSTSDPGLKYFRGSREVDLRYRDTNIKQQFSAKKCTGVIHSKVGTCSAFGLLAAVENVMGGGTQLSERHLWRQYCVPSSAAAIDTLTTGKGVVEESFWPQESVSSPGDLSKAERYKVFEFKLLEDNLQEMLEAMDRGSSLYFALNTPSEMLNRKAVISARSGKTGGGHAVAIVGYKLDETIEGGGYLLVKNSWGTSNGDGGYQWLAMGYCKRKGNYCTAWSIDRSGKL